MRKLKHDIRVLETLCCHSRVFLIVCQLPFGANLAIAHLFFHSYIRLHLLIRRFQAKRNVATHPIIFDAKIPACHILSIALLVSIRFISASLS